MNRPRKLGTLLDGDIVCDHGLNLIDGEYRIDLDASVAGDETPDVPMEVAFPQWNRLRRM
jgi:hypothetical protein